MTDAIRGGEVKLGFLVYVKGIFGGPGFHACCVGSILDTDGFYLAEIHSDIPGGSPAAEANAHLFVAAPDLLDALSDLGQVVDDGMCYDRCATMPHLHRAGHSNVCQAARAAIEKAENR